MNSLKLTQEEKGQIDEINQKIQISALQIENHNLKAEALKRAITDLTNSARGIIGQFCKANGRDIEEIVNFNDQTGEILFKEAESENKDKEA